MNPIALDQIHETLTRVIRNDRGRLLAVLATNLSSFSLAEDCLQESVTVALKKWSTSGIPDNPQGWLLRVSKRQAIDKIRRRKNLASKLDDLALLESERITLGDDQEIPDHRLRLIFTCCHPALAESAQVALTLHTIAGLSTTEIAHAFLIPSTTMGQRLTRAKNKIKQAGIPFSIPEKSELPNRINVALQVIYLIYNQGYSASQVPDNVRVDLCAEALFLARLMVELAPEQTEPVGLLALILFSHARRKSRIDVDGEYIPLEHQNKELWDKPMIAEGRNILSAALTKGQLGSYQLQAAIHGIHCDTDITTGTDWPQIAGLYALLVQIVPTAVVRLNYAVALSHANKAQTALSILDEVGDELSNYQPYFAAKADVLRRLSQFEDAVKAYAQAIEMSQVEAERRFLSKRQKSCTKMMH